MKHIPFLILLLLQIICKYQLTFPIFVDIHYGLNQKENLDTGWKAEWNEPLNPFFFFLKRSCD